MAYNTENFVLGKPATCLFALLWHWVSVIRKWSVSTTLAIWVTVISNLCSDIRLATCVDKVQHVFNLRERFQYFAASKHPAGPTLTRGAVATRARSVNRFSNSHRTFNNFFLWLQRKHVHKCPQRKEAESGHGPERNFFPRLGGNDVTWVWFRRWSSGRNWSSRLCNYWG